MLMSKPRTPSSISIVSIPVLSVVRQAHAGAGGDRGAGAGRQVLHHQEILREEVRSMNLRYTTL